ncbi:MAG: hypothetical protein JXA30_02740 [Deltaproteobacteria bacterium]|nr:hypothetical protein [Deltaproteobacteria bacterium]
MTSEYGTREKRFFRRRSARFLQPNPVASLCLSMVAASLIDFSALSAQPAASGDAEVKPKGRTADASGGQSEQRLEPLPKAHEPKVTLKINPKTGLKTGDLVKLQITADALATDDVTIPDDSFGSFEVHRKEARIEALSEQRQRFIFTIDLIALEPGEQTIPEITLRVVTADGVVGGVRTSAQKLKINSLLANEPDAKPKEATRPVQVMQDDYTLLYIAGGLLAALAVVLLTLGVARWWRRRAKPPLPPPPPRPPWEIAIEKLQKLQREKEAMIEQEKGGEFVDRVSDVVREYLGGRFAGGYLAFTGLETTSSEMIAILRELRVEVNLLQEITAFLFRCDLIKFAKVSPNHDEVDLIFAEAQEIVRNSTPQEPLKESSDSRAPDDAAEGAGGRSTI